MYLQRIIYSGYSGGSRLQVNGTYRSGYTITGTWNPNID